MTQFSLKGVLRDSLTAKGVMKVLREWFPDKSVSLDVEFWDHRNGVESITYQIWIEQEGTPIYASWGSLYEALLKIRSIALERAEKRMTDISRCKRCGSDVDSLEVSKDLSTREFVGVVRCLCGHVGEFRKPFDACTDTRLDLHTRIK